VNAYRWVGVLAWLLALQLSPAAEFQSQQLTTKPTIDPGANIFTNQQAYDGAGSINVFAATDLKFKGNMGTGEMAQMLISPDGKTAYTVSNYQRRFSYGELETVLQSFDVATLTLTREIPLPPKLAMTVAFESLLAQSADGRYIYIQNATPATSVTVVDNVSGQVTAEIPSPGCFGIYPSLRGSRFSTICGDGTFATFALRPDGASADRAQSGKIFDVERDPLFTQSARAGEDLIFVSYHGMVYRLADNGPAVTLVDKQSMVAGTRGGWAPGGYELFGYNEANGILFIGMHPDAKDGSHKRGAREIWAYDLKAGKLMHRSPGESVVSLTVSDDQVPVVVALRDKATLRFESDPKNKFKLTKTHEHANTAPFNFDVVLRP
jgi:methylamine dehydrogenase heavy chain